MTTDDSWPHQNAPYAGAHSDDHDCNNIWTPDNHVNFTLDGEGHLDDEELEPDNGVQDESEEDSCGNENV